MYRYILNVIDRTSQGRTQYIEQGIASTELDAYKIIQEALGRAWRNMPAADERYGATFDVMYRVDRVTG